MKPSVGSFNWQCNHHDAVSINNETIRGHAVLIGNVTIRMQFPLTMKPSGGMQF